MSVKSLRLAALWSEAGPISIYGFFVGSSIHQSAGLSTTLASTREELFAVYGNILFPGGSHSLISLSRYFSAQLWYVHFVSTCLYFVDQLRASLLSCLFSVQTFATQNLSLSLCCHHSCPALSRVFLHKNIDGTVACVCVVSVCLVSVCVSCVCS